jgi:peptidoglycan/LPS O-acetylase OafA/YrhL
MRSSNSQQAGRIYAFDWLRIIACAVVVLIHCVHMFGELYHAQADLRLNDGSAYMISFLSYWCMDLFFLVAGASTWLALRKKTTRQFIKERFQRLLLPLVIGFVLLVPLQAYFELVSNGQYKGSLLEYYPFLLGNILFNGQLSWIVTTIHHLWFLAYLFVFSLVALPLCLYLRSEKGLVWIDRLATLCERPGGLLVPVLPIIVVQLSLRAAFPVYCGLADALCWLLFYIEGYMLFASPRLRRALQRQGKLALELAIAGLMFILILGKMGLLHRWMYTPDYSTGCLLFQILASLTLWSCLLATLSAGDKYLNRNSAFLVYGSTASFWWYMLHFPIVIIVAYYLLPLHLYAPLTFLLMAASSFVSTFVLTELWRRTDARLAQLSTNLHTIGAHWLARQNIPLPTSTMPLERAITGQL